MSDYQPSDSVVKRLATLALSGRLDDYRASERLLTRLLCRGVPKAIARDEAGYFYWRIRQRVGITRRQRRVNPMRSS